MAALSELQQPAGCSKTEARAVWGTAGKKKGGIHCICVHIDSEKIINAYKSKIKINSAL